jgi:hypothetical protein
MININSQAVNRIELETTDGRGLMVSTVLDEQEYFVYVYLKELAGHPSVW